MTKFRIITEDLLAQSKFTWRTPGKFTDEDRDSLILMRLGFDVFIQDSKDLDLEVDLVNAMSDEELVFWKLKNL